MPQHGFALATRSADGGRGPDPPADRTCIGARESRDAFLRTIPRGCELMSLSHRREGSRVMAEAVLRNEEMRGPPVELHRISPRGSGGISLIGMSTMSGWLR